MPCREGYDLLEGRDVVLQASRQGACSAAALATEFLCYVRLPASYVPPLHRSVPPQGTHPTEGLTNAMIASVPGHPFWPYVFQVLSERAGGGPIDATGQEGRGRMQGERFGTDCSARRRNGA